MGVQCSDDAQHLNKQVHKEGGSTVSQGMQREHVQPEHAKGAHVQPEHAKGARSARACKGSTRSARACKESTFSQGIQKHPSTTAAASAHACAAMPAQPQRTCMAP
eukprot:1162062-Pelagomonas_calceolata.AAC.33